MWLQTTHLPLDHKINTQIELTVLAEKQYHSPYEAKLPDIISNTSYYHKSNRLALVSRSKAKLLWLIQINLHGLTLIKAHALNQIKFHALAQIKLPVLI